MSETRRILEETVERLFADRLQDGLRQTAEEGVWPAALWDELVGNGLTMPLAAEARGGAGLAWADAFPLLKALGRHAVPLPLADTAAAGWLLDRAGLDLPDGPIALASRTDGGLPTVDRTDGTLSGALRGVAWGRDAGHVVFMAAAGEERRLVLLSLADASVRGNARRDRNMAGEPRDHLPLDGMKVVAQAAAPEIGGLLPGTDPVQHCGALMRACQLAGALDRSLELAVGYAGERVQFGRAIGKFQAVQQQLALLAGQVAQASMAAEAACLAMDIGDSGREVAAAKIVAGEATVDAASIVHQVHGAIGFTHEHSLHYFTRRLWAWRGEFGGADWWAERLGRVIAARGADRLWTDVTGRAV